MAIHASILGWRIPWTEEPGRLRSTGSQRVVHNWITNTFFFTITKTVVFPPPGRVNCVLCSSRFTHRWVISRSRFQESSAKSFDMDLSHVLQLPQFSTLLLLIKVTLQFSTWIHVRTKVNVTVLVAYSWCVSKRTMTSLSPGDCGPPSVSCVSDGWFCSIYL